MPAISKNSLAGCLFAGFAAFAQAAAAVDQGTIAERVVLEAAGVAPGEVVLLWGTPRETELLQALTAAVIQAGGEPLTYLEMARATREGLLKSELEDVGTSVRGLKSLLATADVMIMARAEDDPELFSDVPQEKMARYWGAIGPVYEMARSLVGRIVHVSQEQWIPNEYVAAANGLDAAAMRQQFFAALAVPADTLAERARLVAARVPAGAEVHVTSAAGTDLHFRLADTPPRVNTGVLGDNPPGMITQMPAGYLYACVNPQSASGTLVIPEMGPAGQPLHDVTVKFEGGRVVSMSAQEGPDALKELQDSMGGNMGRLALMKIGANPESTPFEGSSFASWAMSGVMSLMIGDNSWAGCSSNQATGTSFARWMPDMTVMVDDRPVVTDGVLYFD